MEDDRPHHIIRSVSDTGPVGTNTKIRAGDELLEVNGETLVGMDHLSAVNIIRGLPEHVVLVCARERIVETEHEPESVLESVTEVKMDIQSTESESDETPPEVVVPMYTKSLTPSEVNLTVNEVAMEIEHTEDIQEDADDELVWIDLVKGSQGLGFSILDYDDENNKFHVHIRGLVPNGVAETDGRLQPGDRLVYVNDVKFDMAEISLQDCVQVLKGLPMGTVNLGVKHFGDSDKPTSVANHQTQLKAASSITPPVIVAAAAVVAASPPEYSDVIRESQNFTENKRKIEMIAPVMEKPKQVVSYNILFFCLQHFRFRDQIVPFLHIFHVPFTF